MSIIKRNEKITIIVSLLCIALTSVIIQIADSKLNEHENESLTKLLEINKQLNDVMINQNEIIRSNQMEIYKMVTRTADSLTFSSTDDLIFIADSIFNSSINDLESWERFRMDKPLFLNSVKWNTIKILSFTIQFLGLITLIILNIIWKN